VGLAAAFITLWLLAQAQREVDLRRLSGLPPLSLSLQTTLWLRGDGGASVTYVVTEEPARGGAGETSVDASFLIRLGEVEGESELVAGLYGVAVVVGDGSPADDCADAWRVPSGDD